MSPKVLIFGGGSMGAIAAFILSHSINTSDIFVVCRSNFETIKRDGFTINSTVWGAGLNVRPTAVKSVSEALKLNNEKFDFVCVTTKAVAGVNDSQIEALKPAISAKTAIVLMQNGIAIEDPYKIAFPDAVIISAVLYTPCSQTGPGVFSHSLLTTMQLGTFPADAPDDHKATTVQFVDILNKGGASATHEEDIQISRWKKLLINGSENPICALTRLRDANFFQTDPGATKFLKDVMIEIASVARGLGYTDLDDGVVDQQWQLVTSRKLPGVVPSMMADALEGRQMEVECIIGNVMRMAHELDIPVPRMEALYYLTKGLNASFLMPDQLREA